MTLFIRFFVIELLKKLLMQLKLVIAVSICRSKEIPS